MDNIERAIEEKKYSIKEVSAITGIKEATIRKWEKDFDLNISRDDNNRRYYTDSDIERLKNIMVLKEKGINIHGIRRIIMEKAMAESGARVEAKAELAPEDPENQLQSFENKNGNEVLIALLQQLSMIIVSREEQLVEKIKGEVIIELKKQNEYIREENQKLMKYLEKIRGADYEKRTKKGLLYRLLGINK